SDVRAGKLIDTPHTMQSARPHHHHTIAPREHRCCVERCVNNAFPMRSTRWQLVGIAIDDVQFTAPLTRPGVEVESEDAGPIGVAVVVPAELGADLYAM